jgi:hypothetical protein
MLIVVFLAATVAIVPFVTMISTSSRTSSSAKDWSNSALPFA